MKYIKLKFLNIIHYFSELKKAQLKFLRFGITEEIQKILNHKAKTFRFL